MADGEWKKSSIIESGNYPKNSFKGVLKAIYPKFNEKLQTQVLQLEFEDGKEYNILGLSVKNGLYGVHEDGSVDEFLEIGKFCASLERIDIKTGEPNNNNNDPAIKRIETFWAWLDGQLTGFKTEPDIVGCTLHNVATPKQVGDSEQSTKGSKYPDWTIRKIEGLQASKAAPKPGVKAPITKPKAPAASKPAPANDELVALLQSQETTDSLLEAGYDLTAANTPDEVNKVCAHLFAAFGKKYKIKELRDAIVALKAEA